MHEPHLPVRPPPAHVPACQVVRASLHAQCDLSKSLMSQISACSLWDSMCGHATGRCCHTSENLRGGILTILTPVSL